MNTLQRGFWAGIMATGPINAPLFKLYHFLPDFQRSRHDAHSLRSQMTNSFKFNPFMSREFQPDNPLTSQLGYSVACGVLYAFTQRILRGPSFVKGGFFGLGIWAASRYGWLPPIYSRHSLRPSTTSRGFLHLASHVLWGISLGIAEEKLRLYKSQPETETIH